MKRIAVLAALALMLVFPAAAHANRCLDELAEGGPVIVVSHPAGGAATYGLPLANGQSFWVLIQDTEPDNFAFSLAAIILEPVGRRAYGARAAPIVDVCLTGVHNERYGAHIVKATRRPGAQTDLPDLNIVIVVDPTGWFIGFNAALSVSGLRPDVVTVRDGLLTLNPDAKDAARLGFAGLVSVHHSDLPYVAFVTGMGLDVTEGQPRYYFGGGARLGKAAVIAGGIAFGPVARLPDHLSLGDEWDDIRLIAMKEKVEMTWWLGVSYSIWKWGGPENLPPAP